MKKPTKNVKVLFLAMGICMYCLCIVLFTH